MVEFIKDSWFSQKLKQTHINLKEYLFLIDNTKLLVLALVKTMKF